MVDLIFSIDWLDIVYKAVGIALLIVGIIGCVLPILPGPPLSYVGLLLLHLSDSNEFGITSLVIYGILAIGIQILDYIVPVWGTKKFGGTKYGSWGSIIGLIAGLFFLPAIGPFGILTILGGPFFGALIGERIGGADSKTALKAAFGSFMGFLAGTFMKLVVSLIIAVACIVNAIST